jgi:hypothetical protein
MPWAMSLGQDNKLVSGNQPLPDGSLYAKGLVMATVDVDLTGMEGLQQRLASMPAVVLAAATRAIHEEATRILEASQLLVPVDTEALKKTGIVEEDAAGVVTIRYGGHGSVPYALVQHEDLNYHHDGGQAKYLQQPFFEATAGMAERLAASIRQSLGGL